MNKTKGVNNNISVLGYFFRKMWNHNKRFYAVYSLYILSLITQPFINIFCPKLIIDEMVNSQDIKRIIMIVSFMIVGNTVISSANTFLDTQLSKIYYEDLNRKLEADIGKKCMELKFVTTESKDMLNYVSNAKLGIKNAYSGGMSGYFKAFSLVFSNIWIFTVTILVVVRQSWILLIIVIVNVIINTVVSEKLNKIQLAKFDDLSFIDRGFFYLLHTLSDIRFGKDIRLYRAKKMMIDRVDDFNNQQAGIRREQAGKSEKYVLISKVDMAVTSILTYLILEILAVDSKISIGDFTMLATSVATLVASLNVVLKQILELKKFVKYANEYVNFIENNAYEENGDKACDFSNHLEIEFKNVSFKYPGQEKYSLRNINAKIEDGEHCSIVGLNGAGKTTFIKLLCRFYECTEGDILVNGLNIQEYDYEQYMKIIGAVFQDFYLLNFSIKENIIVAEGDSVDDAVVMPLVEKTGLKPKVASLPLGVNTPVFRYYDMNGFEPSGGEQQKMAMARALYKDAPILILDEPTAALDPVAEKEIYEQFNEMANRKTTFFVSHRLASCKFCDRIFVFKDGEIVECGTHDELMRNVAGLYSEMYTAQQQYYV